MHPIHRDAVLDADHQLMRNDPKGWFTHYLSRALVFGESVIEGNLIVAKS